MLPPYGLKSQYWLLEEQKTLYRNSKDSLLSFFVTILILLVPSPDQLVITQFPHSLERNWGAAPCAIPVQCSLNDVFSRYQVTLVFLSVALRSNTVPKNLPRSKNAGEEGMPASSI